MDRKRLTRREFLEIVAQQSVGAKIVATALLSSPYIGTAEGQSAIDLDVSGTETLIAIVDEIIPAVDGMPAASQVGTLAYFELLAGKDPELARTLQRGVTVVEDLSRERFSSRFRTLSKDQRVDVLSEFEKTGEAGLFTSLQDYVYEAYYLEPRVWGKKMLTDWGFRLTNKFEDDGAERIAQGPIPVEEALKIARDVEMRSRQPWQDAVSILDNRVPAYR